MNLKRDAEMLLVLICFVFFTFISKYFFDWYLFNAWIFFSSITVMSEKIQILGKQILTREKNRKVWMIKQIFWCVRFTMCSYLCIYAIKICGNRILGIDIEYLYTDSILRILFYHDDGTVWLSMIGAYCVTLIGCLLACYLVLFRNNLIAFLTSTGVVNIGDMILIYINHGNSSMKFYLRNLIEYGITIKQQISVLVFFLFFILLIIVLDMIKIEKFDVI